LLHHNNKSKVRHTHAAAAWQNGAVSLTGQYLQTEPIAKHRSEKKKRKEEREREQRERGVPEQSTAFVLIGDNVLIEQSGGAARRRELTGQH
jgi:hypothetical protein